ncbi:hypothetical protein [Actinomycetospora flava]|uniref:Uncharacterized protein n=1 Tax=Actinomycetospora flava TaxID=3129232 RepID=A0ABU8MH71_9PSEU
MPPTARRSTNSLFKIFEDPDYAPETSQLHDRPLAPEPFTPEKGRGNEVDGAPLSKFGAQFRAVFARYNRVPEDDVPLGLLRYAEALNASTDVNLQGLAHPVPKYTEYGELWTVSLLVNTPMLMAWLINGRALRRLASKLKGEVTVITTTSDHANFSLPTMSVHDKNQVMDLLDTQRELVMDTYSHNKEFLDPLARQGVLNPPQVVFTELVDSGGRTSWTAEAMEGARRTFGSQLLMNELMGRGDAASLATRHWFDGDGLRDLTPEDLRQLEKDLLFSSTDAAGYFPGRDARDWLDNAAHNDRAAVTWQLLRTMRVELVIAVRPNERTKQRYPHAVSAVVQEFIRSQHVPNKTKRQWDLADVAGQAAITIIDRFDQEDRIDTASRAVWLGQVETSWDASYRDTASSSNRLVETVRLIAALTVQHGVTTATGYDGLRYVNETLGENALPKGPKERARIAASQAVIVLNQANSPWENALAAMLEATFRDPMFWKGREHSGGNWTTMLGTPLDELAVQASAELATMTRDGGDPFGPAQRALAALGAVALATNPKLLVNSDALSRTGRGGGGRRADVSAADPPRLLAEMLRSQRGLDQLHDAIYALIAVREPFIPVDRESGEELTDIWLRDTWLTDGDTDGDDEDARSAYMRMLREIVKKQQESWDEASRLRDATDETILDPDLPPDQQTDGAEVLFETIGVPDDLADEARTLLRQLEEFFVEGRAFGRTAARYGRNR